MKLLEHNLLSTFTEKYDISIGYVNEDELNIVSLNSGIIDTKSIAEYEIAHCCEVTEYSSNIVYSPNTFIRNDNKVYVCLFAPDNVSIYAPTGNVLYNQLMDDNYVWRYICEVKEIIHRDYITLESEPEIIRRGAVQAVEILLSSGHSVTDFDEYALNPIYMSGTGIDFQVENSQINFTIECVLIQNGGTAYSYNDMFVITDKIHHATDLSAYAEVNVYVEDGEVKLDSFTNGYGYTDLEIMIIGDGTGAELNYSTFGGLLTTVTVAESGSGYTWAKAIVLNSDKYVIGQLYIEPLNGYNCDLSRHLGPNKYIISKDFTGITSEINFYGIHEKVNDLRYKFFDHMYLIESFLPLEEEKINIKLVVGQ